MPTAQIVQLCQGVTDALNNAGSGAFSQDFTAVFQYAPQYTLPDTEALQVIVTDAGGDVANIARSMVQYRDTVRVCILWRVADAGATGIDPDLMAAALLLSQEITEFLLKRPIGDYKQTGEMTRGEGEKDKSHYFPGNLDQGLVFASDLRFSYVTGRAVR